jgi:hypothetical protein
MNNAINPGKPWLDTGCVKCQKRDNFRKVRTKNAMILTKLADKAIIALWNGL